MNIDELELEKVLADGESLTVEFKSDRQGLPDRELVKAVVALANTEGGSLYLGVEDDGSVSGLHQNHQNTSGLEAMIANRTTPSVAVIVDRLFVEAGVVALIKVPKSRQLVATSDGTLLRRRIKADGRPEATPLYPHEFAQRLSSFGAIDVSATPIISMGVEDLDPIERIRLRGCIRLYRGDSALLELADDEFDGALGMTANVDGVLKPTVAGLIVLGRDVDIKRHLPFNEIAFQVLEGSELRINQFLRKPLLKAFEEIETLLNAKIVEQEIDFGLFRAPVPNYSPTAIREALVNAVVHRDYLERGAIHIRFDDDGLTISSPGGLVEGVTLSNLLVTEPRPRNPLLADIVKRIGLAERTGRGIDRIFEGLLRYGRPAPDYGRTSRNSVVLFINNSQSDFKFFEMILNEERRIGKPLYLDSLIILSALKSRRRLSVKDLTGPTQKSEDEVRRSIEKLVESGLVESYRTGRSTTYTLSSRVYRDSDQKAEYVRQTGLDKIQHPQMVINFIKKHGSIKRSELCELCRLSDQQAYKLLKSMKEQGILQKHGTLRYTFYTIRA